MESEFTPLNDDEVLHVTRGRILLSNPTFRISELLDALAQLVGDQEEEWSEDIEGWFAEGLECEALRIGNQGWQRGRVRIRVEFAPSTGPKLLKESVRPPREEPRTREEPRAREEVRPREEYRDEYPDREDYREGYRRRPSRENIYQPDSYQPDSYDYKDESESDY
ncbi:MAG TPA: KGK domain-containing protein [Chroococcidiopsis sp.]